MTKKISNHDEDIKAYLEFLRNILKKLKIMAEAFYQSEDFTTEGHALAAIHHIEPIFKQALRNYNELIVLSQKNKKKKKPRAKTAQAQVIKFPVSKNKK